MRKKPAIPPSAPTSRVVRGAPAPVADRAGSTYLATVPTTSRPGQQHAHDDAGGAAAVQPDPGDPGGPHQEQPRKDGHDDPGNAHHHHGGDEQLSECGHAREATRRDRAPSVHCGRVRRCRRCSSSTTTHSPSSTRGWPRSVRTSGRRPPRAPSGPCVTWSLTWWTSAAGSPTCSTGAARPRPVTGSPGTRSATTRQPPGGSSRPRPGRRWRRTGLSTTRSRSRPARSVPATTCGS